ncbi:MAG: hypothetical protein ABIL15_03060 [candidate division WOR-3 bacterium]
MNILTFFLFSLSGVDALLLPMSPRGFISFYSKSGGDEGIFYNPAKFEAERDFKISCFYNILYVGLRSLSLALSKETSFGMLGIGITNFDAGNIELHPPYPTEDTTINYTASNFSFILCGARKISSRGRLGINLKYISENIYVYGDYTLAFDIALSYSNEIRGISLGAANIGSSLTLRNEEVSLPTKLSLGLNQDIKKFKFGFDLHYLINRGQFESSLSGDFSITKEMAIGIALNRSQRFYPGFNLNLNLSGLEIKYGGAFYPYDLGLANSLGLSFKF